MKFYLFFDFWMKKIYFFTISSLIITHITLFTWITNGQSNDTTYTSRSCKVYTIEYVDNLQAYTSPNLKKQEYFINTDYFKRYIDSKNQQLPNCPINWWKVLNSYVDNSSNQNRFTAPNGKIYFISQQWWGYTADWLSNQKTFKTIDELKNYIKTRNPLALLTISNNDTQTKQQTINENSNQQHGSADTQNQYNQNQNNQDQNNQDQNNQNSQTQNTTTNKTNTTQYGYCYGLPANAYRINEKFIQTYQWNTLYPINKAATYSSNSSVECAFVCNTNYTRNYTTNKCEANNEDLKSLKELKNLIDSESSNKSNNSSNSSKTCKSWYVKIDWECVKENRFKDCYSSDLPDNAKWVNWEFEQYRDWDERYPKKITPVYSRDDETECSFVCKSNYTRNSKTKKCEKKSGGWWGWWWGWWSITHYYCTDLPENASPNNNLEPIENTKYYYSTNTWNVCSFSCNEHYKREDPECKAETQQANCTWYIANSQWINPHFTQTRSWDSRYPASKENTYTWNNNIECSFICESNYERKNGKCEWSSNPWWNPGGWDNPSNPTTYSCSWTFTNAFLITWSDTQLTENTISKLYDDIESAWNNKCAYACNTNYHANSTHQTCEPNTQQANCTWYIANSQWINSHFTQTRSWDSRYPASKENTYTWNNNIECSFICESNYERKNDKCEWSSNPWWNPGGWDNPSNPTTYSCSWTFTNAFLITWSDSQLTQNTISKLYDDVESAWNNKCAYVCNNHYHANSRHQACEPDTQQANCTWNPTNSHWVNSHFSQIRSWSSRYPTSISNTYTWNNNIECSYLCEEHYEYDECRPATQSKLCPPNLLPQNSHWINQRFTQTRNWNTWAPSTFQRDYENQHTNNSAVDCAYHCDNDYQLVNENGTYKCEKCKEWEQYINGRCEQYTYTCSNDKPNYTTLITWSDVWLTSNDDTISKLCYTKGNKLVYKDKNNNEVDCDTNVKCAYICNEYYEYENWTCIAKVNANEYCGENYKSIDDNSTYTLEVLVDYDKQPGLCKDNFYVGELPKDFVTDNWRTNPLYRDDDIKHYYDTRTRRCYYSGDNNIYSTSCHAKKIRAKCWGAAIENTEANDGSLCSRGEAWNLYNNVWSHVVWWKPNPENLEDLPEWTKLKERTCGFNEGSVWTQRGSVECHIKPDICWNAEDYHFLNTPTDTTTSDWMKIYLCWDWSEVQIITGNWQTIETKDRSILSWEISETEEWWTRTCTTKFESSSCSTKKPIAKCGVNSYQHNPNQSGYITKPGWTDWVWLCLNRDLLKSDVTENYEEWQWKWQCLAKWVDGVTSTDCTAKMWWCKNIPISSTWLKKSTDIYTWNTRLEREYVDSWVFDKNSICKWTCTEWYTKQWNSCVSISG